VNLWFDPAAYTLPAFGTFSNTARNVISGPGWQLFDMSFQKVVRFAEKWQLELRADAFNVFNHTQFDAVGTTYTTPATFGKVTSTRNERSFMVGARIQF
jgi:hypothetical protein